MSWHEIGSLKSYVSQTLPTIGNLGFGSVVCSVLLFLRTKRLECPDILHSCID